jgi:hypothetical protein
MRAASDNRGRLNQNYTAAARRMFSKIEMKKRMLAEGSVIEFYFVTLCLWPIEYSAAFKIFTN